MTSSSTGPVGMGQERKRGSKGRFVKSTDTAERDAEAARLRTDGLSYREIAKQLGFADESGAYMAAGRALDATRRDGGDKLKAYEIERLDVLYRAALDVLRREHLAHGNGRVVERLNPATGRIETLRDSGPELAAIDRLLKIQERRAKLEGIDSPTRHSVDADALGREILAMLNAPATGGEVAGHDGDG